MILLPAQRVSHMDACVVPKTLYLKKFRDHLRNMVIQDCEDLLHVGIATVQQMRTEKRYRMKFQPIMDKEGRPCISGRDLFASFHLDILRRVYLDFGIEAIY